MPRQDSGYEYLSQPEEFPTPSHKLCCVLLLLRVSNAMDTVHIRMSSHITPVGPTPTAPTCTRPRPRSPPPSGRPSCGIKTNTPPPPVHSLAAPSPLLSSTATPTPAGGSTSPTPSPPPPLCIAAAASRLSREDEGHRRVPERPGARQGRHRSQGLGMLCSLPPARRYGLLVCSGGWGLVPSGRGRFSAGVPDPLQRFRLGFTRGFLSQAKVADLQDAIHARSKWIPSFPA